MLENYRCQILLFGLVFVFVCVLILLIVPTPINEPYEYKEPVDVLPEISRIYYINLDKRKDRDKEFMSNFSDGDKKGSRIERISAVETPYNGAVGCLLSHVKTLRRCLENNDKISFVCEDDLEIFDMKKLNELVSYVIKNLKNWDVIMVGCNSDLPKDNTQLKAYGHEIKKVSYALTTSGYIIRKEYVPKLLQVYEDTYNKYCADYKWITEVYESDRCWCPLQKKDMWLTFYPRIAKQRPSFSDIGNKHVDYEAFHTAKTIADS